MSVEQRLKDLGITLPVPAAAVANYVPFVLTGNLVFVSGQLPLENGKPAVQGQRRMAVTLARGDSIDAARSKARAAAACLRIEVDV